MSCKSLEKYNLPGDTGRRVMTVFVGSGNTRQQFSVHKSLLQNSSPYWANNVAFESESGQRGLIFLNEEDPIFAKWLYHIQIPKAPTRFTVKAMPSPPVIEGLEKDLHKRFNEQIINLVNLYGLAEKYDNEALMSQTIDTIQDGFYEYGTVFGPGMNIMVFEKTNPGSKLRDLCVGANIIHLDRGCTQLREEITTASMMNPAYFSHMLKWISRNFVMFTHREQQGYDIHRCTQRFSMFNRSRLCPCHFQTHIDPAHAHQGHNACAIPFLDCSHGEEHKKDESDIQRATLLSILGRGM